MRSPLAMKYRQLPYVLFSIAALVALLWPISWKQSGYDMAFKKAGSGVLSFNFALIIAAFCWAVLPSLAALICGFVGRRIQPRLTWLWFLGWITLTMISFRGFSLGKRWHAPYCSGVIVRANETGSADQWKSWVSTNWSTLVATVGEKAA